jgi:hypothetical protein
LRNPWRRRSARSSRQVSVMAPMRTTLVAG